jgi:hypothetical protein
MPGTTASFAFLVLLGWKCFICSPPVRADGQFRPSYIIAGCGLYNLGMLPIYQKQTVKALATPKNGPNSGGAALRPSCRGFVPRGCPAPEKLILEIELSTVGLF